MKRDNHQGGVLGFRRVAGDYITRHDHAEIAVRRIESRAQHAGIRESAGDHKIVHVQVLEQELEVGRIERAQAFLGADEIVTLLVDLDHEIEPFGSLPTVLIHGRIRRQIHLIEPAPVRFPGALARGDIVDAAVSLPVLDHDHRNAGITARSVELIVRFDHVARARRRACGVRLDAKMAAMHVDTNDGGTVRVEPRIHGIGDTLRTTILQITVNVGFHFTSRCQ